MDKELKSHVVRLFLQFIQKYVPISEVLIASMGGEGREAAIWQEIGILDNNGWLIERGRKASSKLIREFPYRYQSSLAQFSRGFASSRGNKAGLDAFHLDLKGTLEPNVDDARRMIPLVLKGRGRCLAITVADARRNSSIDHFAKIAKFLGALLGFRYDRMREKLLAERGEDRELAVMREIGFFFSVVDLFKFYGRFAVPDRIQRYAFNSHTSGQGFPMRTYFFHFKEQPQRITAKQFAALLYRVWFREPLVDLNHPAPKRDRAKEKIVMAEKYPLLRGLAASVGGALSNEITAVLAAANRNGAGEEKFERLAKGLSELLKEALAMHNDPPSGETPANGQPSKRRGARDTAEPEVELPKNGKWLSAMLVLVKAKAKGRKAYDEAMTIICRDLKLSRKPNRSRIVGSMFAHTHGKFRQEFLQKLAVTYPAQINDDLAVAFSKLDGKDVTLEQLKAEAGL